jgi:hypothetical protein
MRSMANKELNHEEHEAHEEVFGEYPGILQL